MTVVEKSSDSAVYRPTNYLYFLMTVAVECGDSLSGIWPIMRKIDWWRFSGRWWPKSTCTLLLHFFSEPLLGSLLALVALLAPDIDLGLLTVLSEVW